MTNKARTRICKTCESKFVENYSDSNNQWSKRMYCSARCNNSSQARKDKIISIFERLELYQVKKDGCWGWTGTKNKGYGALSNRNGREFSPEKAHRISYEQHYGEIPIGMYICHKCDNPECTNPNHLFLGTAKDNSMDCSAKGRLNPKSLLNLIDHNAFKPTKDDTKNICFLYTYNKFTVNYIAEIMGTHKKNISKILKSNSIKILPYRRNPHVT